MVFNGLEQVKFLLHSGAGRRVEADEETSRSNGLLDQRGHGESHCGRQSGQGEQGGGRCSFKGTVISLEVFAR